MVTRFNGDAPPATSKRAQVHRVTTSEAQQFIILSAAFFGQYVHWHGGRTHKCTLGKSRCDGCEKAWNQKWLGYLDVLEMDKTRKFLELTRTACNMLCDLAPPDKTLRGLQVRIRKTKGGRHGRYLLELLERRVDGEQLPQEADPLPTLEFLWNCKNQHVNGSKPDIAPPE